MEPEIVCDLLPIEKETKTRRGRMTFPRHHWLVAVLDWDPEIIILSSAYTFILNIG